jgi:hypothetical protein
MPVNRGHRLYTGNDRIVPRRDEVLKGKKDDAQKQCDSRTIKCELLLRQTKMRSPKYMY